MDSAIRMEDQQRFYPEPHRHPMRRRVLAILVLAGLVPLGFLHPAAVPPGPRPLAATSPDVPTWLVGDSWTFETHAVTRDGPNWTSAWNNLTFTVSSRMAVVHEGAYLYLYNSSTTGDLSVEGDM